ncbi:MAG TPA: DinB family protein [Mucilaginibacter sp.]|nr:DinB family protein [Mucilaginibacter sp.]
MSIIEILLKEIEQEAQITRKMLSIVPNDKYDWQPHPKSMTIKQLATHIAELPSWITMGLTTDGLDFASNPYSPADINNTADLLEFFENSYADGRAHLEATNEAVLQEPWVLRNGDQIFLQQNKYETVRVSISQTIHHQAQLGVFLRLLNIPIPGSYGPSADEQF